MHELDVVHLDLKPTNILFKNVNGFPHLQIADFGFARQFNDETNRYITIERKQDIYDDENKTF
jgi:serine/threonine protein kinase